MIIERRTNSIYHFIPDQDVRSQFPHVHLNAHIQWFDLIWYSILEKRADSVWPLLLPKASTPCCTPLPGPQILTRRNQVESAIVMLRCFTWSRDQGEMYLARMREVKVHPARPPKWSRIRKRRWEFNSHRSIIDYNNEHQCNIKDYYGHLWTVILEIPRFRDCTWGSQMVKSAQRPATTFGLRMASASTRWLALWHPEKEHCGMPAKYIAQDIAGMLVDFSKIPASILHSHMKKLKNGGSLQMLTRTWFPHVPTDFLFLCRVEDCEGESKSETKLFHFHTPAHCEPWLCLHFTWTPKAHVRCGDTRQPGHRLVGEGGPRWKWHRFYHKHIYLEQLAANL